VQRSDVTSGLAILEIGDINSRVGFLLLLLVAGCIWKMFNLNGSVVKQVFITAMQLIKNLLLNFDLHGDVHVRNHVKPIVWSMLAFMLNSWL
jgi:hypothetical protein